jgi:amino acid transporter
LLGIGLWVGPSYIYGFLGDIITIAIVFMYGMANIALFVYMRREHPGSYNTFRHAVLPFVGTLLLLPVIYVTFVPFPPYPLDLVPYIVIGWMVIGAGLMWYIEKYKSSDMMAMTEAFQTMDADFDPEVL